MKFGTLFIALLLAGSTAQAQIPTPTPEYPDSPKTGDDSKLWLWILLASGSLTVLITVSIVSRKKRKAL